MPHARLAWPFADARESKRAKEQESGGARHKGRRVTVTRMTRVTEATLPAAHARHTPRNVEGGVRIG